ncbi:MAG: hypothetical protein SFW66_03240 [Gammaproteobacteria bacterium]|nr:hypothetical protein [Gammaproteobacteria bacterium]
MAQLKRILANTVTYNFFLKKNLILLFVLALFLQCQAFASTVHSGWRKTFLFGYGITNADQTQTVHIADTPSPGLDNRYVGSSKLNGSILFGFALEKEFATSFKNSIAAAGFEMDYLRNKSVNGTVEPMVNVSPDFDILKYFYDIQSIVLQATAKLTKQELFHNVSGYIQAGLGPAINQLSNYREYAPGDSTASPMLSPYGDKTTVNPALSAGIGVTYKLKSYDAYVSFGYRFFYTGRGKLTRSPAQQTSNSISLSPIYYQFLVLSLSV